MTVTSQNFKDSESTDSITINNYVATHNILFLSPYLVTGLSRIHDLESDVVKTTTNHLLTTQHVRLWKTRYHHIPEFTISLQILTLHLLIHFVYWH